MSEPTLTRSAGVYRIDLDLLPSLSNPSAARVTVTREGRMLESIEVKPDRALDVFKHTALYSAVYAFELTESRYL